ncbi:unnamed protein product [Lymnaea stagnalis]|uniref:RRM domain-containing protein n=1 Tax=Lymnaea stagnalis TaxID=6523 RepID=A0AAV2HEP6_LYMST
MAEKFSHLYSVFVGNLHEDVSENELCDLFMGSGEVVDHVLIKGKDRNKSNFGFVRYATQEEAVKSIKDFNGWSFKSQRIIVDIASNSGQKLNFAQPARSDEMAKLSFNDPPPSLWSTSSHDSVLNYNRVKETCSWVTDEFFATTHGGICNTEHIINDLDKKEKATLLPVPLIKPTGTTSYRMVIKSLKDWESSLNIPPDQSSSSSVQNHYNIILEEVQRYLKPLSALDESPVCQRGGNNSPVGQLGEFNSPVGQSGDDHSTVPPGDNYSPVGQAEDINNSPVGQSGEFNSPVGQSGDDNSTVPPGDNNSPLGLEKDINNSPVGKSGDNNSPQSGYIKNAPGVQLEDHHSPVNESGDNISPVGLSADINNSPVTVSYINKSSEGQLPEAKRPITCPATDPKMPELISHDNSNNIMVLMKQRFLLATHLVTSPRPTCSPHMSGPAQFPAPPLFPPPQPPTSSPCTSLVQPEKADGHRPSISSAVPSCQVLLDFRSSMRDRMRSPAHVTKDCKTLRSTAAENVHFVAEERDESGWTFDKEELCTNKDQWARMAFEANCFQ